VRRWSLLCTLLLVALPSAAAIKVELRGVEDEVKRNVQTFLSVERYRERDDIDADTVNRLFNRIDGEVREALRPFGYYEPDVRSQLKAQDKGWLIDIDVAPGEPVRVRHVSIVIEGPGADDPAFKAVLAQRALREGMRLNHGTYEAVKGELIRTAAGNGYLAAKLVANPLLVDVQNHSARIDLKIETGPRYNFGAINIEQSVIRPQLMRRYLRFSQGEPYNVEQLLRTQFALDDSLYFSTVEVAPGEPDAATLTVPVSITATKGDRQLSLGAGYGTDTSFRGTLGWTNTRLNERGHRLRFEIKASQITRRVDARYDIPIGDPALERFSLEAVNKFEDQGDLDTNETSITPSITRVRGGWQWVTRVSATRTSTDNGVTRQYSNLLVPGITLASVPEGFLGESLFSRALYVELIGSQKALGSDADFLRLLVQSEKQFNLTRKWHLLLRGEMGTSLVKNFDEQPAIYRFFAGGDRSVRGFGYQTLSPEALVTDTSGNTQLKDVGGKHLLVGSVELVRDLPRNLAVATFIDAGNAFNHFGDKLEYAAGVGFRYRLPVVSLGVDVAKPLSTSGNWRLHLNITPKL
jgi:translocation and assembly module TamA